MAGSEIIEDTERFLSENGFICFFFFGSITRRVLSVFLILLLLFSSLDNDTQNHVVFSSDSLRLSLSLS